MKSLLSAAALGLAAGLAGPGTLASATDFGPASLGFSTASSNVSYDFSAGTLNIPFGVSFAYNGGNDAYFSNVSDGTPGSGFSFAGQIRFSLAAGTLIRESLPDLITVTTPTSGSYHFNADRVGTAALSHDVGSGDWLTLYLEGTMGGGNDDATPTATDVVFNMSNLQGIGGTVSGTIFNPPEGTDPFLTGVTNPVPEPAGIAVLGLGLAGLLGARRGRPARTR